MKNVCMLAGVALLLGLQGCVTRLTDFTVLSTKNVDLSRMGEYQRTEARVVGEDLKHVVIFVPMGVPNAKEAIDRAIESVPGGVALVDGVIEHRWWYIPYIYGQLSYTAEGTVLVDPRRN